MSSRAISIGPRRRPPDARRLLNSICWLAGAVGALGLAIIVVSAILPDRSGAPEVRQPKIRATGHAGSRPQVIQTVGKPTRSR